MTLFTGGEVLLMGSKLTLTCKDVGVAGEHTVQLFTSQFTGPPRLLTANVASYHLQFVTF